MGATTDDVVGTLADHVPSPLPEPAHGLATVEIDRGDGSVTAGPGLLLLLGIDGEGRIDGSLADRIHPHDRAALRQAVAEAAGAIRQPFRFDRTSRGDYQWFEARLDVVAADTARMVGVVVDIEHLVAQHADLRAVNAELQRANRVNQAIIAAAPDVIHTYDLATKSLSRAMRPDAPIYNFADGAAAAISGRHLQELVPAAELKAFDRALETAETLADGEFASLRHRVVDFDGRTSWLRRRIAVLTRDAQGAAETLVVFSTEITEVVENEERIRHAATHDDLTGLPNRRRFITELEQRLSRDESPAVILLNLDGFKLINDLHGRETGDVVLRAVSRRLASTVRGSDLVARVGADEFGLIVSAGGSTGLAASDQITAEMHVAQIAGRVAGLLREPLYVQDGEMVVSARAGVCLHRPGAGAETMIRSASAAVDHAKHATETSDYYLFDEALESEIHSTEHIERNLRRALRNGALEVYYQPIVAPSTGRVRAVEALVRLKDETGVILPVEQVIKVAERCSLVTELDDQVLREACRQVAQWRRSPEYSDLKLTLNRSAKDLNRPGFHDRIMRRLSASELPANALTLEITETVLLDVTSSRVDEMNRLRDSCVGFAIDDFGTGYASMSQLTALPISTIKIDRSFTSRMLDDPTCAALVRASINIASDLELSCVVEGVESEAQLRALPVYDRLYVQGFLYGRPRPQQDGLGVSCVPATERQPLDA